MHIHTRRLDRYPELHLHLRVRENWRKKAHVVCVDCEARGALEYRLRLRDDVGGWAKEQKLCPKVREDIDRDIYEVFLKDWSQVADFLLTWLGEETFQQIIEETEMVVYQRNRELAHLDSRISELHDEIRRLQQTIIQREKTLVAAATAFMSITAQGAEGSGTLRT